MIISQCEIQATEEPCFYFWAAIKMHNMLISNYSAEVNKVSGIKHEVFLVINLFINLLRKRVITHYSVHNILK
jgi:hypothetical protein